MYEDTPRVELAYRVPGKGTWTRRSFRTEDDAEAFVDRLFDTEGTDVEVRWAEEI